MAVTPSELLIVRLLKTVLLVPLIVSACAIVRGSIITVDALAMVFTLPLLVKSPAIFSTEGNVITPPEAVLTVRQWYPSSASGPAGLIMVRLRVPVYSTVLSLAEKSRMLLPSAVRIPPIFISLPVAGWRNVLAPTSKSLKSVIPETVVIATLVPETKITLPVPGIKVPLLIHAPVVPVKVML